MSIGTLVAIAESTDEVLAAGRRVQEARSDLEAASYATDLLARGLEDSLGAFAPAQIQGFDSGGGQEGVESVEDALTIAASQLSMAVVALAAGAPEGADVDLGDALDDLASTNGTLQQLVAAPAAQGFDAAPVASVDLPAAIGILRSSTDKTLETIATTGANLCLRVLKSLPEGVPFLTDLKDNWDSLKSTLDGIGERVGRLAKLALRLVAAALDRLAALVPSNFITAARDRLQSLVTRLDGDEPGAVVFGAVLNFDRIHSELDARLSREGLNKAKLDSGSKSLGGISRQYDGYMGIASNVANALNLLHKLGGYLTPVVPHFVMITASAHFVLLAVIVALSVDFTDAGTTIDIVRGVRLTIEDATG